VFAQLRLAQIALFPPSPVQPELLKSIADLSALRPGVLLSVIPANAVGTDVGIIQLFESVATVQPSGQVFDTGGKISPFLWFLINRPMNVKIRISKTTAIDNTMR